MAVGDAHVFPGFLKPVTLLTELFFPKPPTPFLTCFCRGERRKNAGKKVRLNRRSNSQPKDHKTDSSIYLGILGQPFYPIFPHFFLKLKSRTTFQNLLNILKNIFKRYIIQNPHIIYLTYISKSFKLKSIFYIHIFSLENF